MLDNSFVGRTRTVRLLRIRLLPGSLTTVMGTAGLGKSRLVAEALRDAGPRWVVREPDALGLRAGPIIVIDGPGLAGTRLTDAVERYRRSHAAVVVVARDVVGAPNETVIPLGPLSQDAAIQLFLRRHPADVSDDEEDAVLGLVNAVGGIPLAVELAAAQALRTSIAETQRSLCGRLDALAASGARMVRRRVVREVVDWALDGLERTDRAALACAVDAPTAIDPQALVRLVRLRLMGRNPHQQGPPEVHPVVAERLLSGLQRQTA